VALPGRAVNEKREEPVPPPKPHPKYLNRRCPIKEGHSILLIIILISQIYIIHRKDAKAFGKQTWMVVYLGK